MGVQYTEMFIAMLMCAIEPHYRCLFVHDNTTVNQTAVNSLNFKTERDRKARRAVTISFNKYNTS